MNNCRSAGAQALGDTFDDVVVPHLAAARRLARWLTGNEHDAEDVVQEASLRALRYFHTFTGGNGRAWFLRIVRNMSSRWRSHSVRIATDLFDEETHSDRLPASDPETLLLRMDDGIRLGRAIGHVPDRYRELLVLRELNGLTYRELADATGSPIGSVMSGLSRARHALREALYDEMKRSGEYGESDGRSDCDSRSARLDSNERNGK